MRPAFEFLLHAIDERQGAYDVDATLSRLGTQGWTIAGTAMTPGGRLLIALQREIVHDDHALEPLAEEAATTLAAPNASELEALPALELRPPDLETPRAALITELAAYRAEDAREAAICERTAAFVAQHEDALQRTCEYGHVTASAWVVDRARTRALLVHHTKLNRWLQPGGHLEPGDAGIAAAALREACEETGAAVKLVSAAIFDVDVHRIPAGATERAHEHYDIRYLAEAEVAATLQPCAEVRAARWFALAEVTADRFDESVRRLARKSQTRNPAPS